VYGNNVDEIYLRDIPDSYQILLEGTFRAIVIPRTWNGRQTVGCGSVFVCYPRNWKKGEAWADLNKTRWPRFRFDGRMWVPFAERIRTGNKPLPIHFRKTPFAAAHGNFPNLWSWAVCRWVSCRPGKKDHPLRAFEKTPPPSAFSRLTQLSFDF
jgi:hypothetical protein